MNLFSIWIVHLEDSLETESCLLSQTDSTSAAGWIKKSNFADTSEEAVQLTTARKLASILIDSETCIYSQWFQGDENQIADALSRDFHLTNDELTSLILTFIPEQAPFGLTILPVPPEIYSWLICLLRNQPSNQQWLQEPIRSKLWLGNATFLTSNQLESKMIPTSTILTDSKSTEFLEHSQTQSGRIDLILKNLVKTNQNSASPPSNAWHRPTEWLEDLTQHLTPMENLLSFYQDNSEATPIPIHHQNNKQPLQVRSLDNFTKWPQLN